MVKRVVLDIESNGLLSDGINYTQLPYRLKPDYKVWCVVCRDVDTDEVTSFVGEQEIKNGLKKYLEDVDEVVGHNIISFDMVVLFLWAGIDYRVGYSDESDTLNGKPVIFWDTLVLSKLLYSAKLQGHSLEDWGKRLGDYKGDHSDWSKFSQEMLDYCVQDTAVNRKLFFKLMEEYKAHNWSSAYRLELKLVDLTVKQEHYGFWFNKDLAEKCVAELDLLKEDIRAKVNPVLPKKIMTKGDQAQYVPPKIQFLKNGKPSAHIEKWVAKHNGHIVEEGGEYKTYLFGGVYSLPLPQEPLVTHSDADVEDVSHIKWYLLTLGWIPSEYKERDLTVNEKKVKRSKEDYETTVERYVKQTLEGLFKDYRLGLLDLEADQLKDFLLAQDTKKPVRVPTSPSLTKGVEKEICPNLQEMADKFPFAKEIVSYYTYKHRRNSIAGGLDEEGEATKGFLSVYREDGRVPTPADTNGANTSRYQHRVICNIPRVTSLYGKEMRSLFGVDRTKKQVQLGFDFSSLEAVVQGHFCLPYTGGAELAKSLVAEKPNDVHSVRARLLGIDRNTAKTLGYSLLYGAQPKKVAKSMGIPLHEAERLYNAFWEANPALKEFKEKLETHWKKNNKEWVVGFDGRKLYSRSKHSLINLVYQNAGALIAKYTSVYVVRALEERGLYGDPFREDVHATPKVMQMIAYHDEAQYSLHQSLVKFEVFENDEDAEKARTTKSSAVCHVNGKTFLAYSVVAETIGKAIQDVCKHLKFRLPLGFEWQVGDSWASCH